jgi:hypothetical protein
MKRIRVLDISISALIVLLIAFALAPAVARLQRSPADAKCQSNLRQWAKAMELYLVDNHKTYPWQDVTHWLGAEPGVVLSPEDPPILNPDGTMKRYVHGVNWVEALYPYVWASAAKTDQDWKSFRKCPNAQNKADTSGGLAATASARMTYVFNCNLIGFPGSLLRNPASLMMIRETDRRVNSILRPINISMDGTAASVPRFAFLTNSDPFGGVLPNQHATGSYTLFADGHIRYFTTDYYPYTPTWDAVTGQWYNFVYASPANDTERAHNRTIAITP